MENESPLASVIVPSYNYGHFLREAIGSLQAQTLANWECIVVDDGSTDDTESIARRRCEEDHRVRYVRQENAGLSAARNAGLARSRGRYIQFLDADDLLEADKLARQVAFLEGDARVDIVYGDACFFDARDVTQTSQSLFGANERWMPRVSGCGSEVMPALVRDNIMVVNAPLVRRAIFSEVGVFDRSLRAVEDWDLWLRCAGADKCFAYLNVEGTRALVRSHDSMSKDRRRMVRAMNQVRRKIGKMALSRELLALNRETRAGQLAILGRMELEARRPLEATLCFLEAARVGGFQRCIRFVTKRSKRV